MDTKAFRQLVINHIRNKKFSDLAELLEAVASDCATDISFNQWHSYGNAVLARRTGQINDAVNVLERLLTQDVEIELKGRIYTTLGRSYEFIGQWDVALKNYQLAFQFHQTHQDILHQGIALNNMGGLYQKGKEYEQAIQCLLRAKHLLHQFPKNKDYQVTVGYTYTILAGVYLEKGDFLQAEQNYLKALGIAVEHHNSWGIPFAHVNLGETYYNLKQYQQAEYHYQEALNGFLASENERSLAYALWRIGQVTVLTDVKKASIYFTRALELAKKNNRHELIVDILLDQAKLFEHQGDEDKAFAKVKLAQGYAESLRANITLADDRARMTAMLITAYEQMVQYLLARGQIAEAFYYAEMGKSRTFIETLEQQEKMSSSEVPPAWLEEEQQVRQKLTTLYRERKANNVNIRQLETSLHQIRERIRVQSATSQAFHTATPLTLEQVQARLPQDAVLVEYITIEDELWCFVITTNTVSAHHLSLTVSMLQKAFKTTGKEGELGSLHNLTRSPDYHLRPAWMLKKLYSLLIEPLGEQVEEASLLCLVPHGLLHYVPFHALYKQTTVNELHYLNTADRQIIYASSATVLLDYCQMTRNIKSNECLALGFNGTLLRQAEAEAHAIADLLGGTAITGAQATRQHVLDVAHQYRYLHFSCHGWFNSI